MRSSQKSGRSRGKGNRGGKQQGHSPNRVYESAGPEGKVRGTPQQIIDKYLALARDAQLSGDRVGSENFLQHAEHYARILIAVQEAQQDRREQNQQNNQNDQQGGRNDHQGGRNNQSNARDRNDQDDDDDSVDTTSSRREPRRERSDYGGDDQPASDGLGAIDAAQEGSELVDTPESKAEAPKPRTRRPRPKPVEDAAEKRPETDGEAVEAAE